MTNKKTNPSKKRKVLPKSKSSFGLPRPQLVTEFFDIAALNHQSAVVMDRMNRVAEVSNLIKNKKITSAILAVEVLKNSQYGITSAMFTDMAKAIEKHI